MDTERLKIKLVVLMARRGYMRPGGKTALANSIGIHITQLSKAMNGHYKTAYHTRTIIESAIKFLSSKA
jgi:DNA-binding transcriptional regulator YdaS (Cro superfamily)